MKTRGRRVAPNCLIFHWILPRLNVQRGCGSKATRVQVHHYPHQIPNPTVVYPKTSPQQQNLLKKSFRLTRFGKAMRGNSAWDPPGGLTTSAGIDLIHLPQSSVLVDVWGRIGNASIALADTLGGAGEGLRFVVQDRERVVEMGREGLNDRGGGLAESGRFLFQGTPHFIFY